MEPNGTIARLSTYQMIILFNDFDTSFLAIYCSAIPQIANGFAVSATNVSFAGMARYECYDGFSFASGKKHEEIFCTEEARWTQAPKCKS